MTLPSLIQRLEEAVEKPIAIDLFCGLGGWTDGLLAEGYQVFGFDIERHIYGDKRYPAQLVIQDVLTLHGSQFRNAALIVASPPCQEFSYMAMPWKLAKQKRREYLDGTRDRKKLTALFDSCFRLQREACESAGRRIPLIVENVRGAQEWVGRARWNFGSFYLWGDVPALMPRAFGALKWGGCNGKRFDERPKGNVAARREGRKGVGAGAEWFDQNLCKLPSSSPRRKAASAMIAKIPLPLSRHIAATFKPSPHSRAA